MLMRNMTPLKEIRVFRIITEDELHDEKQAGKKHDITLDMKKTGIQFFIYSME